MAGGGPSQDSFQLLAELFSGQGRAAQNPGRVLTPADSSAPPARGVSSAVTAHPRRAARTPAPCPISPWLSGRVGEQSGGISLSQVLGCPWGSSLCSSCIPVCPQSHLWSCNRCLKHHSPHPWPPLQPAALGWTLSRSRNVMVWCLPRSYHFATVPSRESALPWAGCQTHR